MATTKDSAPTRTPSTREKGTCAGCGTTEKALIAPRKNLRDYEGPMYCLSCNPRFGDGGIEELLERLGG